MFNIGPGEIAIVFGLALLIFGPKKLPELGKALGQGIGNFKRSLTDAQHEMTVALKESEKKENEADEKSKLVK
jgi:sec-independent protein translocase protein TatA